MRQEGKILSRWPQGASESSELPGLQAQDPANQTIPCGSKWHQLRIFKQENLRTTDSKAFKTSASQGPRATDTGDIKHPNVPESLAWKGLAQGHKARQGRVEASRPPGAHMLSAAFH